MLDNDCFKEGEDEYEVESGLDDYGLTLVKPKSSEIAGALDLLECFFGLRVLLAFGFVVWILKACVYNYLWETYV